MSYPYKSQVAFFDRMVFNYTLDQIAPKQIKGIVFLRWTSQAKLQLAASTKQHNHVGSDYKPERETGVQICSHASRGAGHYICQIQKQLLQFHIYLGSTQEDWDTTSGTYNARRR